MTLVPAGVRLEAPEPGALRYGLFSVAEPQNVEANQVGRGIAYPPEFCGVASPYAINCGPGVAKTFQGEPGVAEALPFAVLSGFLCGSLGFTTEEFDRMVRRHLTAGEQDAVETALWTGRTAAGGTTLNIDAFNSFGAATVLTPVETDSIVAVVSELEEFAYLTRGYGYEALIHAPAGVAAYAGDRGLVVEGLDGVKRTPFGSRWVFGGGYPGTLADTTAGTTPGVVPVGGVALYVTGQVHIWRSSDVFVYPREQVLDRTNNQQFMLAEREYAISFDCLLGQIPFLFPTAGA